MRARRLAPALHAALVLVGMGCEGTNTPPPDSTPSISAGDGLAAAHGYIAATVHHLNASPRDFALFTFPEWEDVDHSVTVEPVSEDASRFVFVTAVPTEPRWYVVVWRPEAGMGLLEVVGGIPLADGHRAWRVFGRPFPELASIAAVEDGVVVVTFSGFIALAPGARPASSLGLEQPGRACPGRLSGASDVLFECAPPLDWSAPFVLRLANLRSSVDGAELPTFEQELVSAAGEEWIVFPSSLVPPPFPDSLCAAECP